jgi:hypothetical protein
VEIDLFSSGAKRVYFAFPFVLISQLGARRAMSHHVEIRSRSGNVALGTVGAIYFIGAVATLLLYLWSAWGAAGLLDRLLQLALIVSAVAGAAFLVIAADNLGLSLWPRRRRSAGSPAGQRAAAA